MELLKVTLVQRVRIFKALCIATRINKSMGLPPIPLLFSKFESVEWFGNQPTYDI